MKTLRIAAIVLSVGVYGQFALADYSSIGTPMTSEQLYYNNCTEGFISGGCTDPVYWSIYDGWTPEDCNNWMNTHSCTKCKKGYELTPYTCIPDNEQGIFYDACMPDMLTDEEKLYAKFAYTCKCSSSFGETGMAGYLFRGCDTGSIEYKCDTGNKYYQSNTTVKCTVTTDSNGDFKFSRCTGCLLCDENAEYWENSNPGYQRAYRRRFVDGSSATCEKYNIDKWRCAIRYYGTSTNGTSGCNPCPTLESEGLTEICNSSGACPYVSSSVGSTQISQCYAGTWEPDLEVYLKDSTGKFHWMVEDDTITSYGECNYK